MTENDAKKDPGKPRLSSVMTTDDSAVVSFEYSKGQFVAGRYRLTGMIAQGGMGAVWRAHDETLEIDVALKLIRHDMTGDGNDDRLLREARAAAQLGHPAILRVSDFGRTEQGDPFIVMELLEGEDLATAIGRRGRLSPVKAVSTMLPIAHALATAHAKGIVHRDLKPENIFLARIEGSRLQPKLVDFGIAKVDGGKSIRLTQTGVLLGSPTYMSPEQARGDDVDHRADVWSFAIVLYELLTGRLPFEGKNQNAILYEIMSKEAPPLTELSDVVIADIVSRALEKDVNKRFQTMRELGEALAGWLLSRGVTEDITGSALETTWQTEGPRRGPDLSSYPPLQPALLPEPREVTTEAPLRSGVPGAPWPSRAVLIVGALALLFGAGIAVAAVAIRGGSAGSRERSEPAEGGGGSGREASRGALMPPSSVPRVVAPPAPAAPAPAPAENTASAPVEAPAPGAAASRRAGMAKAHSRPRILVGSAPPPPKATMKDPFR